jgi:8-oxo-dGTP diphosphatase
MERFKATPAVHIFLIKDGKILLQRRLNTGYQDGKYGVPSGHLEGGEPATEALAREVLEETTIVVRPEDLELVHTGHRMGDDERVDFYFTAKRWQGEPKIAEPDKADDLRWFPIDKLPENTTPYTRFTIGQYLEHKNYSEFGWDK